MTRRWLGSLQLRLALRVAALYIVATLIAIGVLMSRAYDTARMLSDRELIARANELAKHVSANSSGVPRLDLPPKLSATYDPWSANDIFVIRDAGGHIIAASPLSFGHLAAEWPPATHEPAHFNVRLDTQPDDYDGLSIKLASSSGPLSISVGRSAGASALVYSLLRKFIHDIVWAVSFLVIASLAIGILAVRSGLKPVRNISEMAAGISPHATSIRLPEQDLPSEIRPLVTAVNRALDRLEDGFAVQRRFTANAAHELRTPLAIITAALEAMDGDGELVKLKTDVTRMNRLVEQLLSVARLDAVVLDINETVDLNEIASSVVATMAPWALSRELMIAFSGSDPPSIVKGNGHAIADAIRNLVENAVLYSPVRTEVWVITHSEGKVSVADRGGGIPAADRQRIFDRFWRGKGADSGGAGLGLAIVREIMKAHGGTVTLDDSPQGGAVFTLCFIPRSAVHGTSPAGAGH